MDDTREVPRLEYQHERILQGARDEMALISQRLTWFLTIQGFLFTSAAISLVHMPFFWFPGIFLPVLGWTIASKVRQPLSAALGTVTYWLDTLDNFYSANPGFQNLALEKERSRKYHERSNQFPRDVATVFQWAWVLLGVSVLMSHVVKAYLVYVV